MLVRFPDGSHKPTTTIRATYRLDPTKNRKAFVHPEAKAEYDTDFARAKWRVDVGGYIVHLEARPATKDYAFGASPGERETAYVMRRDGECYVLQLWDVEATPCGPDAIPFVDYTP